MNLLKFKLQQNIKLYIDLSVLIKTIQIVDRTKSDVKYLILSGLVICFNSFVIKTVYLLWYNIQLKLKLIVSNYCPVGFCPNAKLSTTYISYTLFNIVFQYILKFLFEIILVPHKSLLPTVKTHFYQTQKRDDAKVKNCVPKAHKYEWMCRTGQCARYCHYHIAYWMSGELGC